MAEKEERKKGKMTPLWWHWYSVQKNTEEGEGCAEMCVKSQIQTGKMCSFASSRAKQ